MQQIISGVIDSKPVEVIDMSMLVSNRSLYPDNYTALDRGDEYIYPVRSKADGRPGAYVYGGLIIFKPPTTEEERKTYSRENVVNFSEKQTVAEIIQAQESLYNRERTILTTADNIFKPPIDPADQPEMVLMKMAVSRKNCDIDKYEQRLGPNYNNEKRIFKDHSITLLKIKRIAEALDMKVTMTIEDASPDVPNPMGTAVTIQITGGANV